MLGTSPTVAHESDQRFSDHPGTVDRDGIIGQSVVARYNRFKQSWS